MPLQRPGEAASQLMPHAAVREAPPVLDERLFRGVLLREGKRADRSDRPLALLVVTLLTPTENRSAAIWPAVIDALADTKRVTDVVGWLDTNQSVAVILPEVPATRDFPEEVAQRVQRELARRLAPHIVRRLRIRLHVHPELIDGRRTLDPMIADVLRNDRVRPYDAVKRAIDMVGSLIALAMLSPVFAAVAVAVKLTSPGPIFFRQERIGKLMTPFRMLKFRTMRANNDPAIHHQFVSSFITSGARTAVASDHGLFKIANDPRVTPVGRFLRRTSLDELPQLWNVLRGDMSLVGPRPPIQYEVDQYKSWHTRRVVEVKPGITGLWQVKGRSRTTFDEMVRLDLQYARTYSFWTDMRILLATPRAVISGKGAC